MKRKSILLVLCIGMVLTSCKNIKTLNDSDVKNEKSQKKTVMEIQDKGYDLPIDEKKKKEVVTKAENNYLSSECSNSTTSYGKINTIRANNLASAQRKNQVHHKKIGGR